MSSHIYTNILKFPAHPRYRTSMAAMSSMASPLGKPHSTSQKTRLKKRRFFWHQKCFQKHGPAFCSQHAPSWDGGKLEKKRIWWSHFWKFGETHLSKVLYGMTSKQGRYWDTSYIMSYTSKPSQSSLSPIWISFEYIPSRFHPNPSKEKTSFLPPPILTCHLKIDFWKRSFWT